MQEWPCHLVRKIGWELVLPGNANREIGIPGRDAERLPV